MGPMTFMQRLRATRYEMRLLWERANANPRFTWHYADCARVAVQGIWMAP